MYTIIILVLIYLLILFFTFLSEVTYHKKTLKEVRLNSKQIIIRTTIIFAVMLFATYLYHYLGIKTE